MIRRMEAGDRKVYLALAKQFYESDAVVADVPGQYLEDTFDEMMRSRQYFEGFVLLAAPKEVAGYGLTAKTWSQEAGGMVLWVEELFILPEYRSLGLGREFFEFVMDQLAGSVKRIRLEVEGDNVKAMSLYRRLGFEPLPYVQMVLEAEDSAE